MFNCLLHGVVRTPRQHNKRTRTYIGAAGRSALGFTQTPKVCKIMAFMAVIMGLGLFFLHTFGV